MWTWSVTVTTPFLWSNQSDIFSSYHTRMPYKHKHTHVTYLHLINMYIHKHILYIRKDTHTNTYACEMCRLQTCLKNLSPSCSQHCCYASFSELGPPKPLRFIIMFFTKSSSHAFWGKYFATEPNNWYSIKWIASILILLMRILCIYIYWLVVWTPLKNISQLGWLFPTKMGKTCVTPPTSIYIYSTSKLQNPDSLYSSMILPANEKTCWFSPIKSG